jgi:guanyl-specific ribonuclease Sa
LGVSSSIITIAATIVVVAAVTVATVGMGTLAAGAIIGASGGFTSGALGTALNGGNLGQILGSGLLNAGIGALSGMAGGAFSAWATKGLGGALLGQLNVKASSALGGLITGGIGGYAGGFAGGFVTGLVTPGDLGKAFEMGNNSGITGAIISGTFNGIRGFRDARAAGNNGWTGNARSNDLTKALGIDETLKRISNGEAYPHKNDGTTFRNNKGILPDKTYGGYKEYVHPTPELGTGIQRIVIGNEGEIYYTPDHYGTFIKIP